MAELIKRKLIYGAGALGVIAVVFVLTMGLTFGKSGDSRKNVKLGATAPPITHISPSVKDLSNAFISVAKAVTPAVVQIRVTSTPKAVNVPNGQNSPNNMFRFFFGPNFPFHSFNVPQAKPEPEEALGSGIIVNPEGYIITNNHVVRGADPNGIKVTLLDRRTFQAKLIGRDPTTDVAVIKIDGKNLPYVSLGNSDSVHVGEWVVAIGNPFGLDYTVTQGIVSALGRNINIIRSKYGIEDFIQTDAVINPGNSGGPLVDLRGRVIGINTAIATNTGSYEGYGFAIPIDLAKRVAEDIIRHGKVLRPYIGVSISNIDQTMARALGLKEAEGVMVQSVVSNSPAQKAGIKAGDVILKFDGTKVLHPNQLQALVASKSPGEKATVEIFRDGKTVTKTVTLEERTGATFASASGNGSLQSANFASLGLSVQNADKSTLKKYGSKHGVLVTNVEPASEAYNRGIQQGDLITSVDNKPIDNSGSLKKIVNSKKPGDALLFRVKTKNKVSEFLAIQIPPKQ